MTFESNCAILNTTAIQAVYNYFLEEKIKVFYFTLKSENEVPFKPHDFNNKGQYREQLVKFTLLNKYNLTDPSIPFHQGSDIEEFKLSVKSERYSLAEGLNGSTVMEQVTEFFDRCASVNFCYVAENKAYCMNTSEFKQFLPVSSRPSLTQNSKKTCLIVKGSEYSPRGKIGRFFQTNSVQEVTIEQAKTLLLKNL